MRNHLQGFDPQERMGRNFTIGVYPILPDETCWFLAADFDKATWQEDARAFLETCSMLNVPAALERSRSGNGGHIWMFFVEPIPAVLTRQMGTFLLSKVMNPDLCEGTDYRILYLKRNGLLFQSSVYIPSVMIG